MTAYTAYFDASGSQTTDMMAVGGFIANDDDWKQFETEWNAALAWAKVPYFHMKKFTAKREPFDNKRWEREEHRKEFLGRLIDAIARNVDLFALNILPLQDWSMINKEYCMHEERLTPFAVASCGAMLCVEEWCRANRVPWSGMEVIFEHGDLDRGDFEFWCKKTFHKSPLFKPGVPDKTGNLDEYPLTPLQACDFIAWEARRAETDVKDDPPTYELRRCFSILLDRLEHYDDHEKWNEENLRSLCVKHNIKRRSY